MRHTKDINIQLINLEIKAMEYSLMLTDFIIDTVKKFDGKQANKRLDTALKKIDDNLKFKMEFNSFSIEMYIEDRSISDNSHAYYIQNTAVNIFHGSIKSSSGDGICQDDVIRADLLIKGIKECAEYTKKSIRSAKAGLKNLDNIINKRAEIIKQIEAFNNDTDYMVRSYFDLTIRR